MTNVVAIIPPNESIRMNAFGTARVKNAGIPMTIREISNLLRRSFVSFSELMSPMPVPAADVKIANNDSNFKMTLSNSKCAELQSDFTNSPTSIPPFKSLTYNALSNT